MPSRAWIAGVALGLAVVVSALAQEPDDPAFEREPITDPRQEERAPTSQDSGAQEDQPATDIAPFLQGIESALRDLIAEEYQAQRERQEQREIRDLEAQQSMAWWAGLMFWATFAMVLLTFAALIAIIRTLKHTRTAAEHAGAMAGQAKLATKAAFGAVQATREIGQKQVRAYLAITAVPLFEHLVHEADLHFRLDIRNTGQSPAYGVTYSTLLFVTNKPFPGWDALGAEGQRGTPQSTQIASGDVIHSYGVLTLTEPQMAAVFNDTHGIYIACRLSYRDTFGNAHSASFLGCMTAMSEYKPLPDGQFARQYGIASVPGHNQAD